MLRFRFLSLLNHTARPAPPPETPENRIREQRHVAACAMQGERVLPWEVPCRGVLDGIQRVVHIARREGRRCIEEALRVRGYCAGKNLSLTDHMWPVPDDNSTED